MSTLHTVSRSPYRDTTLESCLRLALPGSAVLLLEDAVYAAAAGGCAASLLAGARVRVFALAADLEARGLGDAALADGVQVIDYDRFVDLACEHDKVQAWL